MHADHALHTEAYVESEASRSESGTSVNFSNSGIHLAEGLQCKVDTMTDTIPELKREFFIGHLWTP